MREVIVLDLQKSASEFSYPRRLRARRGDSRSLSRTFQITEGGSPLDLRGLSVTFMAENAGGGVVMEAVQADDATGQFTYRFPDAVVAVEGTVDMAYFRVEKSGEYIGSTNQLFIEVLGDVSLTNDVTGDYVPMLDQIMEAAEELANNAGSIMDEATSAINACASATGDANQAATYARETAADTARDLRETISQFVSGFMVEYDDLTDDCKQRITASASSGVVMASQEEIDKAYEEEIAPAVAAGGQGVAGLTEDDFGWAISRIVG